MYFNMSFVAQSFHNPPEGFAPIVAMAS